MGGLERGLVLLAGFAEVAAPESLVALFKQLGGWGDLLVKPQRRDQHHRRQRERTKPAPFEYLFPCRTSNDYHNVLNHSGPFWGAYFIFIVSVNCAAAAFFYAFHGSIYEGLMPSLSNAGEVG